jgi:hypothetical protein
MGLRKDDSVKRGNGIRGKGERGRVDGGLSTLEPRLSPSTRDGVCAVVDISSLHSEQMWGSKYGVAEGPGIRGECRSMTHHLARSADDRSSCVDELPRVQVPSIHPFPSGRPHPGPE